MAFVFNDNSLLLEQYTNRFFVYAEIELQISYLPIRDLIS